MREYTDCKNKIKQLYRMIMQAKYFNEVHYRDFAGVAHTHLVHNVQMPLPPAMASGLTEPQIAILNHQDYWVCLDSERIAAELQANLQYAEKMGEDGIIPYSTRAVVCPGMALQ